MYPRRFPAYPGSYESYPNTDIESTRLNAKADPLGKPKCAQSPSAYVAAMEEFKQAHLDTGRDGLADAVQGGDEEQ
jgi:hypothetical protein